MKRIYSLPSIGLILAFMLASMIAKSQHLFTAEVTGKGKPMILIHGLYCNGEVWKETVDRYKDKYECHIITLSGFGGNAPAVQENFLSAVKDDVIAYVKEKKLKKPVIMGHSMGGFISLWAAATAPGLFDKVITVDGLAFLPAIQMPLATPESSKDMANNMRTMIGSQTPEQVITNQRMYLPTMIASKERVEQVAAIAAKADSKTQGQVMYELFTTDIRQTISAIDCPVLVLGAWIAYKDYGVTHDLAMVGYKDQVKSVKNCQVELSDTAKHFIFYDDPAWFNEKVETFLK